MRGYKIRAQCLSLLVKNLDEVSTSRARGSDSVMNMLSSSSE